MQQRANAGGLYGAILGLGVSMLVQHSSLAARTPLAIQAVFALYFVVSLYAVVRALRVPETLRRPGIAGAATAGVGSSAGGEGISALEPEERIGASVAEDSPPERRLSSPRYLGLLGAVLLTGTGHGMLAPLMMIYLMAKTGASIGELALAYLPAGIVWATLPEKAGRIGDRHGRRRFMILGLLSSAAVAAMVPASVGLWPLAIMWAAEAAALSLAMPAEQATVSDLTAAEVRGQAYGYYDAAYAGGLTLAPLLGGWLFDHVGHAAPFYADAVILLVAAAVVAAALWGLHNPGTGPGSAAGNRGIS